MGRQACIPVDIMFGSNQPTEPSPSAYAFNLKQLLASAYKQVRDKMGVTFQRQKQFCDKIHGNPFQVGDLVWLHSTVVPIGQAKKFHYPWTGPYEVIKRLSDATYRIVNTQSKCQ